MWQAHRQWDMISSNHFLQITFAFIMGRRKFIFFGCKPKIGSASGNLFVTLEGTPGALTALQSLREGLKALECRQGSGSTLKCHKQVS